jgi:hypothetical protein
VTVWVAPGIADKPRVRHLPGVLDDGTLPPDDFGGIATSLCGRSGIVTAAKHDRMRRQFGFRRPLTLIDYDRLPLCRHCVRLDHQGKRT